jgi:glycosyltransferase involved in cell wall biosynthesis
LNIKKQTAIICLSKVNGGMELASVKLARILSSEMPIIFIARKNGFIEKEQINHFKDYDINVNVVNFRTNFSLKLIMEVRTLIKKHNIKNIIFLGASEMKSLYFSCIGLDVNFIIRQGSKKTTPKKDFLHRLFYSQVNHFVGNCEYIKNNIKATLAISSNATLSRIYSSLKLPKEINNKILNDTLDIVLVGRINPGKGQLDAIKACEVLHSNNINFTLTFLGDIQHKQYHKEILDYLNNSSIKSKINIVGYTTQVQSYLQKSDIFLLPSLGEGMSNAIIEALGYGLITVIYDDTSSPEFKDIGFNIHLTKENNVTNLQNILLNISNNIQEEKQKALNNMPLAREIFSTSREKNEYMNLLK